MTPPPSRGGDADPDVESQVRRELAAREDVVEFTFHEVTPKSVEVEIVEVADGARVRRLYRVEIERRPESEEATLHWVFLGDVSEHDG